MCWCACSNKVDLNRNFPDPIEIPEVDKLRVPLPTAQPETLAVMKWFLNTQ